jgi:hypothetical protein
MPQNLLPPKAQRLKYQKFCKIESPVPKFAPM